MIQKLRTKLIVAAMLSLIFVLIVLIGAAGALNYRDITTNADNILHILQENDGKFPVMTGKNPNREERKFSPELPYETRYFTVFLKENGTVSAVDTGKIAAIDTETAISYAKNVTDSEDTSGFIQDYRFLSYSVGAETHIIFLDYGREMSSFRKFLYTSAGVSLGGLLTVFLLLLFVSGKIVKPFAENYQKQKQFITDAGHELKTPLTIIDADAQVLEMDLGENEWLSDIQAQTNRLAQLTNHMLMLSRMEEQPQVEKITFPLSDVVQETAETFQTLAKTRSKTLTLQIEPMLSLRGDEKAIRQLISILLDNAMKYSEENGKIIVSLKKQKNRIQLSVYNTTTSIKKENLPHLFDRFYRTDQSRNSRTGGYGLGLSIAYSIVAAHKGKIWAETADEKSLQITASFPCN